MKGRVGVDFFPHTSPQEFPTGINAAKHSRLQEDEEEINVYKLFSYSFLKGFKHWYIVM
jgi:hypothetical protein